MRTVIDRYVLSWLLNSRGHEVSSLLLLQENGCQVIVAKVAKLIKRDYHLKQSRFKSKGKRTLNTIKVGEGSWKSVKA